MPIWSAEKIALIDTVEEASQPPRSSHLMTIREGYDRRRKSTTSYQPWSPTTHRRSRRCAALPPGPTSDRQHAKTLQIIDGFYGIAGARSRPRIKGVRSIWAAKVLSSPHDPDGALAETMVTPVPASGRSFRASAFGIVRGPLTAASPTPAGQRWMTVTGTRCRYYACIVNLKYGPAAVQKPAKVRTLPVRNESA